MLYNINAVFESVIYRGVAQFGRALRSGRRGRGFESRHLDQIKKSANQGFTVVCGLFAFI